jgi:solute:Na+ symporter, SSS family
VFAGFLKLLVPVLVVLPGIIAFRLYAPETGLLRAQCVLEKSDLAFPTLVTQLLPAGFTGLVMAGLMGCVMSHIASMMSASSSIITFDIYKNYIRRDADGAQLVRFGRITSLVVLLAATGVGFFLQDLKAIFIYIQKYWSIAYPSVCALFLAGFFYKRATAKGALIAIIAGPAWALLFTLAENAGWVPTIPFLTRAGIDFIFAFVILWLFRTRGSVIPAQAIIDRSFPPDVVAYMKTVPWWRSFGFWATVLVLCVVGLYIRFF